MLCGCDYLEPIKGVGAKTALKLVKEYDTMDDILAHLSKGKNPPPEDWPYEEAKQLFLKPSVKPSSEIDVSFSFPLASLSNLLVVRTLTVALCSFSHSSNGKNLTSKVWSISSFVTKVSRKLSIFLTAFRAQADGVANTQRGSCTQRSRQAQSSTQFETTRTTRWILHRSTERSQSWRYKEEGKSNVP